MTTPLVRGAAAWSAYAWICPWCVATNKVSCRVPSMRESVWRMQMTLLHDGMVSRILLSAYFIVVKFCLSCGCCVVLCLLLHDDFQLLSLVS